MDNLKKLEKKVKHHVIYNKTAYSIILLECVILWLTPVEEIKYGAAAWILDTTVRSFTVNSISIPPIVSVVVCAWLFTKWYLVSSYMMFWLVLHVLFKKKYELNMDLIRIMIIVQIGVIYYMKRY